MSVWWVPNSYGFVRASDCDEHLMIPGDSGGPVFLTYNAYGLMSGYQTQACNFLGPHMVIYSKIGPALSHWNDFYLYTAP